MSFQVQHRRDSAANLAAVTPAVAEIGYDTTNAELLYGDGSTVGGIKLAKKSDVALKAPLASPTFTGVPAAPTAPDGTNTTQVATTGFVQSAINLIKNGVSTAFDTLAEIATELALKATIASPTFTGTPAVPTAAVDTNTAQAASTAFVLAQASASGDGTPAALGTAARGTSTHYARADHVHAPLLDYGSTW